MPGRQTYIYLAAMLLVFRLLLFAENCRGEEHKGDRAAEIVAAVLKAYGGSEAVGKISSVIAKGRIEDYLTGAEGTYARYLQRPGKLRIEVMPEQGGEVRILDGARGWQRGQNGFEKSGSEMTESMIYQYSYLDLPMGFADKTYPVTYGGKRRQGRHEVYLLLVRLLGAPQLQVFIDVSTHLIVRVAADFAMGMMGSSELATEYSDFRPARGVLFPHKLTNYAGAMRLSEIILSDFQINRKMPESLFTPGPPSDSRSKE